MVPDGRAEAAGILVGDKLVEINGRNVLNTEHEIVASLLRNDILINRCKNLRVVHGTYNCSGNYVYLFEYNHPSSSNRSLKFQKFLFRISILNYPENKI